MIVGVVFYQIKKTTLPPQEKIISTPAKETEKINKTLRVMGVLQIPNIPYETLGEDEPLIPPLKIYISSEGESVLATSKIYSDLELKAYSYESLGPLVYDIQKESYYVKLSNGMMGWIRPEHGQTLHTIEDLLMGIPYLTEEWDGYLYQTPELRQGISIGKNTSENHIEIKINEIKKDATGELWAQVDVLKYGICGDPDPENPEVIKGGWIPLYNESGKLNTWFSSRGC